MANYCVLGLGKMGEAILHDLLTHTDSTVYGFDYSSTRISALRTQYSHHRDKVVFDTITLSLAEDPSTHSLIKFIQTHAIHVVYGAIDYKYNYWLTKLCIAAGAHYLDLGGNPSVVALQKSLNSEAVKKNVTIIPDCGLAPGLADILAAYLIESLDTTDECHIRVGGLPSEPQTILNYQLVFSVRGLTNEYLEDAIILRNSKVTTIESLTEVESLSFPAPFTDLEAFHTAGGTSSLPYIYEGKIKELTYKTIRYSGHVQFIQFLKEFGFLSEHKLNGSTLREISEQQLVKHLPTGQPDVVLVLITVKGMKDGQAVEKNLRIIDYNRDDFSAMARTTAFPISILGQFIATDKIQQRGVISGETLACINDFMLELKVRNIEIEQF